MDSLIDAFKWFIDFFSTDAELSIWHHITAQISIWWLQAKIVALQFTWQVAQAMIDQMGISSTLDQAWASVDNQVIQTFTALKIPDCVNILIQAWLTRFVLDIF